RGPRARRCDDRRLPVCAGARPERRAPPRPRRRRAGRCIRRGRNRRARARVRRRSRGHCRRRRRTCRRRARAALGSGRARGGDRSPGRNALGVRPNPRRGGRRGIRDRVQPGRTEALAAARARDRQPLMARIEDYALIGDLQTAALVERGGSVDWLCFPRFDSDACFAALLGEPENGRWLLAPKEDTTPKRRYLHDTLVLETTWETSGGSVRVFDFMPPRGKAPDVVRIVEGVEGSVELRSELVIRFDYGHVVPWVRHIDGARLAVAGPDALSFRTPAPTRGENMQTVSELTVQEG